MAAVAARTGTAPAALAAPASRTAAPSVEPIAASGMFAAEALPSATVAGAGVDNDQ